LRGALLLFVDLLPTRISHSPPAYRFVVSRLPLKKNMLVARGDSGWVWWLFVRRKIINDLKTLGQWLFTRRTFDIQVRLCNLRSFDSPRISFFSSHLE
jgi:hypothetical protein